MSVYYRNHHAKQGAPGNSAVTRRSGCTWTSARNGADAATGGLVAKTPDAVHSLVKPHEETDPGKPGWSIPDAVLAMMRIGVPLSNQTGFRWSAVRTHRSLGQYQLVQGVSSVFGNATCSGAFDGDHCIGVHPEPHPTDPGLWLIDDPICNAARWEHEATLRQYAEALHPTVRFGVFTNPVPRASVVPPDTSTGDAVGPIWEATAATPKLGVFTYTREGAYMLPTAGGDPIPMDKGDVRNVYAVVIINAGPYEGSTAYLASQGDQATLCLAQHGTLTPTPEETKSYPVTVGGKVVGRVVLP